MDKYKDYRKWTIRRLLVDREIENISELARICGIEVSLFHKYIKGTIKPDIKSIFKIANNMNMSVTYFIRLFYYEEYQENQKLSEVE